MNDPANSYDVFRATAWLPAAYGVLTNVASPSVTDSDVLPEVGFYLISARNSCGSSGEEPF